MSGGGPSRLPSLRFVAAVAGSFGDEATLRKRAIILGVVCAVLNGLAGRSAFRGPDWLTNGITILIVVTVIGLVVNLCLHKGDWRFRVPAFVILGAYLSFMAFELWQFFAHAD